MNQVQKLEKYYRELNAWHHAQRVNNPLVNKPDPKAFGLDPQSWSVKKCEAMAEENAKEKAKL